MTLEFMKLAAESTGTPDVWYYHYQTLIAGGAALVGASLVLLTNSMRMRHELETQEAELLRIKNEENEEGMKKKIAAAKIVAVDLKIIRTNIQFFTVQLEQHPTVNVLRILGKKDFKLEHRLILAPETLDFAVDLGDDLHAGLFSYKYLLEFTESMISSFNDSFPGLTEDYTEEQTQALNEGIENVAQTVKNTIVKMAEGLDIFLSILTEIMSGNVDYTDENFDIADFIATAPPQQEEAVET